MFYICIYIYTTALYEHLFKRYMYTFFLFVFSSAKEFGFLPVFVCELVCQQDDTKPTKLIFRKSGWRMGFSPEQTPLSFVVDPDKVFSLSLTL